MNESHAKTFSPANFANGKFSCIQHNNIIIYYDVPIIIKSVNNFSAYIFFKIQISTLNFKFVHIQGNIQNKWNVDSPSQVTRYIVDGNSLDQRRLLIYV